MQARQLRRATDTPLVRHSRGVHQAATPSTGAVWGLRLRQALGAYALGVLHQGCVCVCHGLVRHPRALYCCLRLRQPPLMCGRHSLRQGGVRVALAYCYLAMPTTGAYAYDRGCLCLVLCAGCLSLRIRQAPLALLRIRQAPLALLRIRQAPLVPPCEALIVLRHPLLLCPVLLCVCVCVSCFLHILRAVTLIVYMRKR